MSIAPISQFFILSPRGDTIISKDYRGDSVAGTTDTFFRKASVIGNRGLPSAVSIRGATGFGSSMHLILRGSRQH